MHTLPQIHAHSTTSSSSPSPRGGSSHSASSIGNASASSATTYSSSTYNGAQAAGYKTPSPEQTSQSQFGAQRNGNVHSHSGYPADSYGSMNQMQPYGDVHQPHMSAAAAHAPSTGPPSGMPHYPQYPSSMMHPGQQSYTSAQSSYPQYAGYSSVPQASPTGHPASSSLNSSLTHQSLPLPGKAWSIPLIRFRGRGPVVSSDTMLTTGMYVAMNSGPGASAMQQPQYNQQHTFDTTGQIAPPGMKPRVTATLWEDEGSLCFQVEAKGVCVARREGSEHSNKFPSRGWIF